MPTYDEFTSLIMGTEVIQRVQGSIWHDAALALRDICREYERVNLPVADHHISPAGYIGEAIVRALVAAELLEEAVVERHSVRAYVPTERGQELYHKLVEEGTFLPKNRNLHASKTQ